LVFFVSCRHRAVSLILAFALDWSGCLKLKSPAPSFEVRGLNICLDVSVDPHLAANNQRPNHWILPQEPLRSSTSTQATCGHSAAPLRRLYGAPNKGALTAQALHAQGYKQFQLQLSKVLGTFFVYNQSIKTVERVDLLSEGLTLVLVSREPTQPFMAWPLPTPRRKSM
jgi:hypothetical protein